MRIRSVQLGTVCVLFRAQQQKRAKCVASNVGTIEKQTVTSTEQKVKGENQTKPLEIRLSNDKLLKTI